MKYLIILILALVALVLGALLLKNPLEAPAPVVSEVAPTIPSATPPPERSKAPAQVPVPPPAEQAPPPDKTLEKAHDLIGALVEENKELKKTTPSGPMDGFKKMMETEEGREIMRQQFKYSLNMTHGDLFKHLNLDEETEHALRELFIEEHMINAESGFNMLSANPEERKRAMQEIQTAHKEINTEIEKLLDEESSAIYKDWQDTQMERMVLKQFRMTSGNTGLDEETTEALVQRMRDVRTDFKELENLALAGKIDPFDLDQEKTDLITQSTENMHARYLEEAADLLDEETLAKFSAHLEQQRAMMKMGLKLQKHLIGEPPAETATEQP